jgi:hypothetical protein
MPPYQNESLHDMHALMQQLDDLNAAHALDHLGVKKNNKTEPAQQPQKPAAKPPKPAQKTAATTNRDTAQQEPDTEEPEPYKDDSVLGKFSRFTTKAKQAVVGKPLSAKDVQQSFCEIALLSGGWSEDIIHDMEKMLKNNKTTKKHCPTSKRYTIPTTK